ncbi:MAG: hypothetical protein HRT71_13295 [Flavobacteriales bacterium]|nr:hypothetical protein [Flavobacteriales bacterium]
MKYFILFIALQLFLGFELKAQDEGKEEPEEKEVITNPKVNAARNLIKLKEGTLAIRLFTKQPLIDVYLKRGDTTSANIIITQQLKINLRVMKAFKTYYNFSNVLFFYSTDTEYIVRGYFDQAVFLNEKLEKDGSLKPEGQLFLGQIGDSKVKGISSLTISDHNFVQLLAPFPYMVRKFKNTIIERPDGVVVNIFNERLIDFYKYKYGKITAFYGL